MLLSAKAVQLEVPMTKLSASVTTARAPTCRFTGARALREVCFQYVLVPLRVLGVTESFNIGCVCLTSIWPGVLVYSKKGRTYLDVGEGFLALGKVLCQTCSGYQYLSSDPSR